MFCLVGFLTIISAPAQAQVTNTWVGSISNDWNNSSNWSTGSVPGVTDNVQLGMQANSNQPVINGNFIVATLTMGVFPVTLTVNANSSLTVSGAIIQNHSTDNITPLSTFSGLGSLTCSSLFVGSAISSRIIKTATTKLISNIAHLNINGNLTISSATIDLLSGGIGNNNGLFSLQGGVLSLTGQIKEANLIPTYISVLPAIKPLSKFSIDITSSQNATLILSDTASIKITNPAYDTVDFYHPASGSGISTVQYNGNKQTIYSSSQPGLNTDPYIYQNLVISKPGVKTFGTATGNKLITGGDLTISGGTLDLQTFSAGLTVTGNFVNRDTILLTGSLGATFKGSNFVNAGTFSMPVSATSGPIQFLGGDQQIVDSTATGLGFQFVNFSNTGTKIIHYGNVFIIPNGIVNIVGGAVVNIDPTASFILRADTTGSAAIAAIPQGSSITGLVSVQQFIAGSFNSTRSRGYQYMTSPVNLTGNTNSDRVYGVSYLRGTTLTNGLFIGGPGGAANGFDDPDNSTMYLYREDLSSCNASFYCGLNKGVLKINNPDPDELSLPTRLNISTTPDTLAYMPVANGFLLYFVGNRVVSNGTTTGTKYSPPLNYPENVTLINTGKVNQGNLQVRLWFRNDHFLSYTNDASISNGSNKGLNLVGNPYPSAINWDYLSSTNANSQIYGPNLSTTVYIFNIQNHQSEAYQADSTHNRDSVYYGVGMASNHIPINKGFFVKINASSPNPYAASLLFREGCKQNNQPVDTLAGDNIITPNFTLNSMNPASRSFSSINLTRKNSLVKASNSFRRPTVKQPKDMLIRLKMYYASPDSASNNDEIMIRFKSTAKEKYLSNEDAYDMGGTELATVMLSSYSSDHIPLAINTLPLPAAKETIQLYTSGTVSGSYKLVCKQFDNIPIRYQLKLIDKLTGAVINMRNVKNYAFTIDKNIPGSFGDRFEIKIINNKTK